MFRPCRRCTVWPLTQFSLWSSRPTYHRYHRYHGYHTIHTWLHVSLYLPKSNYFLWDALFGRFGGSEVCDMKCNSKEKWHISVTYICMKSILKDLTRQKIMVKTIPVVSLEVFRTRNIWHFSQYTQIANNFLFLQHLQLFEIASVEWWQLGVGHNQMMLLQMLWRHML